MSYVLAPHIKAGFSQESLKIGYGSIQKTFTDIKDHKVLLHLMHFLLTPKESVEILDYLSSKHGLSNEQAIQMLRLFKKNKFILISSELLNPSDAKHRDNLFFSLYSPKPTKLQKVLSQKHVTIIGCGGIGSTIAMILAGKGITSLTLIDNDEVELSNLNRNIIYQPNDIGKKKITVLSEKIKTRHPYCQLELIDDRIDTANKLSALKKTDFIVISGDGKGLTHIVNEFSYQHNIPFIISGYVNDIAVWGPLIVPNKTACYACFSSINIDKTLLKNESYQQLLETINHQYISPAVAELTLSSAALAALDIIKYLSGFKKLVSLGKRVGYWSHSGTWQKQFVKQNPQCTTCGDKPV